MGVGKYNPVCGNMSFKMFKFLDPSISVTFPSSTLFHYPILLTLADGNIHTTNELVAIEIQMISLLHC